MKTKLLLILVSLAVLTTSLSAQSQDSRNSAFYLSAGYSRLDYKFNYDNIINGINVGAGYFGQIGNTGLFWDGSATFTYGIKEGKINNTKTTSITGAVNLLYQIKLSNIVSLFPYAGPALKYFIYGRTKPLLWSKEGASEFSQYYPWFGDEKYDKKDDDWKKRHSLSCQAAKCCLKSKRQDSSIKAKPIQI